MKFSARKHTIIATLLFCGLLAFLKLGSVEMRPWDEGLYALRAKSILVFDHTFLDQTKYAAGGLYSAVYPPLSIWIMSFFLKIFGQDSLFAVRLYSALCGMGSVIAIHFIARRLLSREMALTASILLAGTTLWNSYSRQGMMDIPLLFWSLMALMAVLKIFEAQESLLKNQWAIVFALAFGAALMTKIVFSLLPLLFLFPAFRFFKTHKESVTKVIVAAVAGILIALPWHIYMAAQHGWEFLNYFFVPYLYSAGENNTRALGIFYYFNQLLVANPFILFTFYFLVLKAFKKVASDEKNSLLENICVTWFLTVFIIFSLAATKMPNYTLYMIPPAILLALRGMEVLFTRMANYRLVATALMGLIILTGWSFLPGVRVALQGLLRGNTNDISGLIFILIAMLLIALAWIIPEKKAMNITARMFFVSLQAIPILLLARIGLMNYLEARHSQSGAPSIARVLKESGITSFHYVYHQRNAADAYNPQLSWYTDGWLAGWKPGFTYRPMPLTSVASHEYLPIDSFPDDVTVYYRNPAAPRLDAAVMQRIASERHELLKTPHYVLYSTKEVARRLRRNI